jgi:hypothetical protein
MAFITSNGSITSFAEYQDIVDLDQRLFDENEGLTDDVVESALVKATARVLNKFRASNWWQNYYLTRNSANIRTAADIPALDPLKIRARQVEFTELAACLALSEYILPKVADFGNDQNAERQKMGYYTMRSDKLFDELIAAGDWYDFDNSGTISSAEKSQGVINLRRVR